VYQTNPKESVAVTARREENEVFSVRFSFVINGDTSPFNNRFEKTYCAAANAAIPKRLDALTQRAKEATEDDLRCACTDLVRALLGPEEHMVDVNRLDEDTSRRYENTGRYGGAATCCGINAFRKNPKDQQWLPAREAQKRLDEQKNEQKRLDEQQKKKEGGDDAAEASSPTPPRSARGGEFENYEVVWFPRRNTLLKDIHRISVMLAHTFGSIITITMMEKKDVPMLQDDAPTEHSSKRHKGPPR
jgi:hypothetical protein